MKLCLNYNISIVYSRVKAHDHTFASFQYSGHFDHCSGKVILYDQKFFKYESLVSQVLASYKVLMSIILKKDSQNVCV